MELELCKSLFGGECYTICINTLNMVCLVDYAGNATILLDWQIISHKHRKSAHHWCANHNHFFILELPVGCYASGAGSMQNIAKSDELLLANWAP